MSWAESRHPPSRHPYLPCTSKNPQLENLLEMLACLTPSLATSSASPARALWLAFPLPHCQ